MAIRVKHNVLVQISKDIDAKEKRYFPTTKEVISDLFFKQVTGDLSADADAFVSFEEDAIVVTLGAPTGCCASECGEGNITVVRFEEPLGAMTLEGTRYDVLGQRRSP